MADKGLKIDITADTSNFTKAIGSINQQIEQIGRFSAQPGSLITLLTGGLVGAGAIAGVQQLFSSFKAAASEANELVDASDRLGISLQKLMSFRKQATLSGSNPDAAVSGLERLQFSAGQALRGSQSDIEAFKGVGITQEMLRSGMSALEIWTQIAEKAKEAGGSEVFKSRLRELGGESLRKSFPMMMSGGSDAKAGFAEGVIAMDSAGKAWAKAMGDLETLTASVLVKVQSWNRQWAEWRFPILKNGRQKISESDREPSSSDRIAANLDVATKRAEVMRKQLDLEEQNLEFQQMNPVEQRADIQRRRNEIANQLPSPDPIREQELRAKDLELRKIQAGISSSTNISLNPIDIYRPKVDALTAIGGSIAGMGAAVSIPTRQLEVMKQNLDELKLLNQQFNQSFGQ